MQRLSHLRPRRARSALLLAALLAGQAALADDDDDRRTASAALSPKYKAECAACHVAFPPDMLPAAAWQRVMGNLPRHYGTDASLDPATVTELTAWLSANAAAESGRRNAPPEDRITRTAWFTRQHDDVPAATWKRPAIRSASNCAACHTTADQGDFNERNVRIPR